jgi:hypothetical protein
MVDTCPPVIVNFPAARVMMCSLEEPVALYSPVTDCDVAVAVRAQRVFPGRDVAGASNVVAQRLRASCDVASADGFHDLLGQLD